MREEGKKNNTLTHSHTQAHLTTVSNAKRSIINRTEPKSWTDYPRFDLIRFTYELVVHGVSAPFSFDCRTSVMAMMVASRDPNSLSLGVMNANRIYSRSFQENSHIKANIVSENVHNTPQPMKWTEMNGNIQ